MKVKGICCLLSIIILSSLLSGCNVNTTLKLDEFDLYSNGKLEKTVSDIGNGESIFISFDQFNIENVETKRGLQVGDNTDKVIQLYGKVKGNILFSDYTTLNEYSNSIEYDEDFFISYNVTLLNGVVETDSEILTLINTTPQTEWDTLDFPIDSYELYSLSIQTDNGIVSSIIILYSKHL